MCIVQQCDFLRLQAIPKALLFSSMLDLRKNDESCSVNPYTASCSDVQCREIANKSVEGNPIQSNLWTQFIIHLICIAQYYCFYNKLLCWHGNKTLFLATQDMKIALFPFTICYLHLLKQYSSTFLCIFLFVCLNTKPWQSPDTQLSYLFS